MITKNRKHTLGWLGLILATCAFVPSPSDAGILAGPDASAYRGSCPVGVPSGPVKYSLAVLSVPIGGTYDEVIPMNDVYSWATNEFAAQLAAHSQGRNSVGKVDLRGIYLLPDDLSVYCSQTDVDGKGSVCDAYRITADLYYSVNANLDVTPYPLDEFPNPDSEDALALGVTLNHSILIVNGLAADVSFSFGQSGSLYSHSVGSAGTEKYFLRLQDAYAADAYSPLSYAKNVIPYITWVGNPCFAWTVVSAAYLADPGNREAFVAEVLDAGTYPNPGACAATPESGCHQALPGRSIMKMIDSPKPGRDSFQFTWTGDSGTDFDEFRDPVDATPVTRICFYDASGNLQPLLKAAIPAGGLCGTRNPKPCWRQAGTSAKPKGFDFKDREGHSASITGIKLRSAPSGKKAKVMVKGKGDLLNLPAPFDSLTLPVTAQLLIGDDTTGTSCWQTTFTEAKTQTAAKFHSKGP